MLREARQRGIQDALVAYGVKEAASFGETVTGIRKFMIGEAPEIVGAARKGNLGAMFRGKTPTQAAGVLNPKEIFWPTLPGKPVRQLLTRGISVIPAIGAVQAARGKAGDPNESRLTNTLGALGSAVGFVGGIPAAGMLGAPILGSVGHRIGKGVGRMISKAPTSPPQSPQSTESMPEGYPMPMRPYSRGI